MTDSESSCMHACMCVCSCACAFASELKFLSSSVLPEYQALALSDFAPALYALAAAAAAAAAAPFVVLLFCVQAPSPPLLHAIDDGAPLFTVPAAVVPFANVSEAVLPSVRIARLPDASVTSFAALRISWPLGWTVMLSTLPPAVLQLPSTAASAGASALEATSRAALELPAAMLSASCMARATAGSPREGTTGGLVGTSVGLCVGVGVG